MLDCIWNLDLRCSQSSSAVLSVVDVVEAPVEEVVVVMVMSCLSSMCRVVE